MNEHDKIMTKHLTERFVDHRRVGLTSQTVAELALHHAERGLDITALVVVLNEFVSSKHEVVKHLLPRTAAPASSVRFESDKRSAACFGNGIGALDTHVSLVGGNFRNLEILSRGLNHSRKERVVVSKFGSNLNSRNDVGFDAAHQMTLNPFVLGSFLSVLDVKPTDETRRAETGRIHGEVSLDRLERKTAFRNQVTEHRSQSGVLKVVRNRIEMRHLGDEAALMRLPQVAHESALRNSRIDFESDTENCVRQRHGRPCCFGRRIDKTSTQISKQSLESVLLVSLGVVIRRPVLRISLFSLCDGQTLSDRRSSIRVFFAHHYKVCRVDVLAPDAASLVVGASASRLLRDIDLIDRSNIGLRRHKPDAALHANLAGCRQFQTALLSQFYITSLPSKYITS